MHEGEQKSSIRCDSIPDAGLTKFYWECSDSFVQITRDWPTHINLKKRATNT